MAAEVDMLIPLRTLNITGFNAISLALIRMYMTRPEMSLTYQTHDVQ